MGECSGIFPPLMLVWIREFQGSRPLSKQRDPVLRCLLCGHRQRAAARCGRSPRVGHGSWGCGNAQNRAMSTAAQSVGEVSSLQCRSGRSGLQDVAASQTVCSLQRHSATKSRFDRSIDRPYCWAMRCCLLISIPQRHISFAQSQ